VEAGRVVGRRGRIGGGMLGENGFWWLRLLVVAVWVVGKEGLDVLDKPKVFWHLQNNKTICHRYVFVCCLCKATQIN
jgi:hypothetical protein